jgi:hypothetical protein
VADYWSHDVIRVLVQRHETDILKLGDPSMYTFAMAFEKRVVPRFIVQSFTVVGAEVGACEEVGAAVSNKVPTRTIADAATALLEPWTRAAATA